MDNRLTTIICGLMLILLMIFASGCSKSDEATQPVIYPSAASLLGLTRNHQLDYIIFDSLVTVWPDSVTVVHDTISITFGIAKGTGSQYELSLNGLPQSLLLTDPLGVMHAGQITPLSNPIDTIPYYPTPLLLPNQYHTGVTWTYFTPDFAWIQGSLKKAVLYINHGYYTKRSYLGTEGILLPSGSYDTYHFRSHLFLDDGLTDTAMVVDEFYATDIGPVKIEARFGLSQRLIILLEDR